ncbi:TatD family hydrolase [Ohessyouella blattaphilus]|uniref:TatD family hydrolase n=1 Tax=Ohessyouella blattaphilus TaxID=2949333 RepID=A0ABT1EGY7_9FIRM|nr:TatD family hydrolase [Ohessyouella blattaphilus]MCP1109970.1 TatD family hydrolase [Ohessyouella blattaphilus]MCR8563364.1 TatD family hydrolase [Ohessyouella blattaphilus]
MIFDTHAHYDDEQFDEDRWAVLDGMTDAGVGTIVNVAASLDSCGSGYELVQGYPHMYQAIGIHPDEVGTLTEENYQELLAYYDQEKVIAVGEIGLDYYWDKAPRDVQHKWFVRQLNEARERELPVIIHSRDAAMDTIQTIKAHGRGLHGVMHAFSNSLEFAEEYIKMGYYLGIGGVVTFKNARKLKEIVASQPIERMLLETDAPYLSPEPFRGKRNTSANLIYVAEEIGKLKGMTAEEVIQITEENARRLFKLS